MNAHPDGFRPSPRFRDPCLFTDVPDWEHDPLRGFYAAVTVGAILNAERNASHNALNSCQPLPSPPTSHSTSANPSSDPTST